MQDMSTNVLSKLQHFSFFYACFAVSYFLMLHTFFTYVLLFSKSASLSKYFSKVFPFSLVLRLFWGR